MLTIPSSINCHCDNIAFKYYQRKYINNLGYLVIWVFYKCINCKSRIYEDFIPEIDNMNNIDIMKEYIHKA